MTIRDTIVNTITDARKHGHDPTQLLLEDVHNPDPGNEDRSLYRGNLFMSQELPPIHVTRKNGQLGVCFLREYISGGGQESTRSFILCPRLQNNTNISFEELGYLTSSVS